MEKPATAGYGEKLWDGDIEGQRVQVWGAGYDFDTAHFPKKADLHFCNQHSMDFKRG